MKAIRLITTLGVLFTFFLLSDVGYARRSRALEGSQSNFIRRSRISTLNRRDGSSEGGFKQVVKSANYIDDDEDDGELIGTANKKRGQIDGTNYDQKQDVNNNNKNTNGANIDSGTKGGDTKITKPTTQIVGNPNKTASSVTSSGSHFVLEIPQQTIPCLYQTDMFIESNLNYGTDGGLSPNIIRNHAFQVAQDAVFSRGSNAEIGSGSTTAWEPVNQANISLSDQKPISPALPKSGKIQYDPSKKNAQGPNSHEWGVMNTGFFAMSFEPNVPYNASFYIRSDKPVEGNIRFGLYDIDFTQPKAEVKKDIKVTTEWQQVQAILQTKEPVTDFRNVFAILFPENLKDSSFYINFVSVESPGWQGTKIRKDLGAKFAEFKPLAVRWPGGNQLSGASLTSRFRWKDTIGNQLDRPGQLGVWSGWESSDLGVIEIYNFITKLGAQLIVGLYAGEDGDGNTVPESEYPNIIKENIEFIHMLIDTDGEGAQLRIKNGGPKDPYQVKGLIIGNSGMSTDSKHYRNRYDLMVNAIKKEFPTSRYPMMKSIDFISSLPYVPGTGDSYSIQNTPRYGTPNDFIDVYKSYENLDRNNTYYYSLEYAVINSGFESGGALWYGPGRLLHSILKGSLAEAVSTMGMERACDIVKGSAYAPELANENDRRLQQSTPPFLAFNAHKVVASTSYLIQKGFSRYRIEKVFDVRSVGTHSDADKLASNQIYYSAGLDAKSRLIVKLVNLDEAAKQISIKVAAGGQLPTSGEQYVVTGPSAFASNTLDKHEVKASKHPIDSSAFTSDGLTVTLEPLSFTILVL